MNQQSHFHPMNQPYINQRYANQRRVSNNNSNTHQGYSTSNNNTNNNNNNQNNSNNGIIIPTYESQRLLQYSQASSNSDLHYNKQIYSRSSTNINPNQSMRDQQVRVFTRQHQLHNQNHNNTPYQYATNQHTHQQRTQQSVHSSHNSNNNKNHHPYHHQQTNQYHSYQQQQQQHQQQQPQILTTQILHEKIHFLQRQLQQLTRLLHQQSKHSYGSSSGQQYQQVAIENAQLTIRVQQLQQEIFRVNDNKRKVQQQLIQLGNQYEKQHRINNQLREKLMELQQKITHLQQKQKHLAQHRKQQSISTNSISQQQQKNSYSASLQRQNSRLNDQIQNLLQKLHNLNLQINQQQSSKDQLMTKMNQQLIEIQKLRKQLSDYQVEKLQLQQMNHYLKQQINQVNQLSMKKLNQLQEKYIKQDLQQKFNIGKQNNYEEEYNNLKDYTQELEQQISELKQQVQQLKKKANSPSRQSKSQPFKQLFGGIEQSLKQQIKQLQLQLNQQKQRHLLIKNKYSQMLQNRQYRVDELQSQNRKLSIQNRTLKIQIQDRKKQCKQLKEQCDKITDQLQTHKTSKTLIIQNSSSKYSQHQRTRYQQTIKINNQHHRRQLQQLDQQLRTYRQNINNLQDQLFQAKTELTRLSKRLQLKQNQLNEKNYLVQELQELQQRHEQLIDQVKLIKKSKFILEDEYKLHQETLMKDSQLEIRKLRKVVEENSGIVSRLEKENQQFVREKQSLNQQIKKLNNQLSTIKQANQSLTSHQKQQTPSQLPTPIISCPLCPQVLKQFNVYKELMQLKFQTMNQMLDQLKISFIRAQFQMKDQIHKDKSKYDHWIQKYDTHDKEYRILMERLWEWEKINARNEIVRNGFSLGETSIGVSSNGISKNNNGIKINVNRPINQKQKQPTANSNSKNNHAASHLSQIQYDLYLIKLQNSTLRSQISTLQKQLSQRQSSNPQIQKQVQQLKKYSDNLLYQNQQLKTHLNQVISQKRISSSSNISSSKQITFGNMQNSSSGGNRNNNNPKKQSMFERYSNIANINTELQQRTRNQQKALASAQLLINKLKKENDNLLQAKHLLQQQLDRQSLRYRQLVKDLQTQRERTRRQHQIKPNNNNAKLQLIDRYNIPFQYIKHHPEHKKLQAQYIALKRSFLQMDLQFKKTKQFYQQQLQKMRIQNEFHRERISQLQRKQQQHLKNNRNKNLFSFSEKYQSQLNKLKQNAVSVNLSQQEKTVNYTQTKIKTLQERVLYLQKQVDAKCQQCESYIHKYQQLVKQLSYHPKTPRNNNNNKQHIGRIQKLTQNIQVSPIQSPQWQTNSAQQQPHSDRLFAQNNPNTISFDLKVIEKLKLCIDKKMIQLQITPRQSSNLVIKATWFIQRLSNDIKQLRNNLEILKGQRKAIMKERNQLKDRLENNEQNYMAREQTKFNKSKPNNNNSNKYQLNNNNNSNAIVEESSTLGLNKMKILKGYQSVPKLNFQFNQLSIREENISNNHQNNFPDVIRETLQLKNQRRSGLKKFQKQLEILASN